MGLLSLGTPLPWEESRNYSEHIRNEGVEQLLYVFKSAGGRDGDPLLWGDEVEYMMVELEAGKQVATLDVVHDRILDELNERDLELCNVNDVKFHPEYGRFMLEATPKSAYPGYVAEYVEYNMQQRRLVAEYKLAQYAEEEHLKGKRLVPLTLTVFPRMGCPEFLNIPNAWDHKNTASRSLFLPDEVINRHARFPNLTSSIRTRRGEKVCINIPILKDRNTPELDDSIKPRDWFVPEDKESRLASKPGHIYLDAMGFGMGCSCLQMTYQAPNIEKARFLYDTLVNFAPVFLAVSAATPGFKGWVADQDVRWNVISGAVDDRTPQERSVPPLLPEYNIDGFGGILKENRKKVQQIPKSRYSVVDLYLGGNENKSFNRRYNDTDVPVNEKVLKRLLENEKYPLDYDLAKHFAHLYIRDPISTFEELLDQDNSTSTNHFENIQSTNWQTLRFKPPTQEATPDNHNVPGWRVEFRPLDIQLLDFENAAFSNMMYMIVDFVLQNTDKINPYVPMSQVWENMIRAHHRDAAIKEKFYWRTTFDSQEKLQFGDESEELSLDEIFHNKNNGIFPVFINTILKQRNFIQKEWQEMKDQPQNRRLYYYFKIISDRASGRLPTAAKFLKNFILTHPDYRHDSKISQQINYDLIEMCDRITHLDDSRGELSAFVGEEIAKFLLNNKLSTGN